MLSVKINILYFVLLTILAVIQCLIKLPLIEDNNIALTETAIRSTVNNLFAALKIEDVKHKPRLKHFSTIHNYFVSITLTDCDNLNQIARLSRSNDADNNSVHYITEINEVLNEDDKETNDDVYVTEHIDKFIEQLQYLKEIYVSNRNVDINEEILKYIDDENQTIIPANFTDNFVSKRYESNENLLSDNEFWQSSGRRIYQGIRTRIKTFPFVASVQFFHKFQCAGSIIKSDLVITSASCLQLAWNNRFFRENPAFLSVQVGSDFYEGGGDNIAVLEIYFHPRYDPKTLNNNLAVMRLTRKIIFKYKQSKVKKIDIDRNPWPLPDNTEKITVIGWGAKGSDNVIYNPFRNKISYADLSFYPLTYCQDHYSREFVTIKHFCAGFVSKGGGACNRDAGGPGIVDDTLLGVISFGSPICGAPDAPTVFTKLGYYASWITNIMKQDVPNIPQLTTKRITRTLPQLPRQTTTTRRTLLPIIYNKKTTTIRRIPIKDVDSLRMQDQGFKDFLSTMFESDEDLNIVDDTKEITDNQQQKDDIETSIENQEKGRHKIKVTKMIPDTAEIETYKPRSTTKSIHRMIQTTDDMRSIETITRKNNNIIEVTKSTRNDPTDNESNIDDSLEKDIMTLIDNLDLKEFIKPTESPIKLIKKDNEEKQARERNIAIDSSSESNENTVQISPKQQSVLNLLFLSEESEKKPVDDDDDVEGISIQADAFSDLTFRDKLDKNKSRDTLTESSLYELISLAIDEEAKRLHKKKRYIL